MIKFKESGKRKYQILSIDGEFNSDSIINPKDVIIEMDLIFSPIANKFDRLTEFIEECSITLKDDFDDWFIGMINEYVESKYDYSIIRKNVPQLKKFSDQYLETLDINFENYINKSKISKNSIFFDHEEIKKIIQVSNYLKIYLAICQDSKMKLSKKFHSETFALLSEDINEEIIYKLFKIVSSKTYEYKHTDHYMWDYIKTIYCKTTDMHVYNIFNFIINNILVTCKTETNPIPYLISVIDESIKWILRSIYKEAIVYSESVSTQDVYSVQGKDKLSSYASNDTIGKLLITSYNQLEHIGISDIEAFKHIINGLKEISLFSNYVTYPILSKTLDIPYRQFMTLPVEHAYLLNLYLYRILPEVFKIEYPVLSRMLLYYNQLQPIIKTTYKIKNIELFTGSINTFMGFKNTMVPYDLISNIIGKIGRNTYSSFLNDKEIINFPLAQLEKDLILFYNKYFDNDLENLFDELRETIDMMV